MSEEKPSVPVRDRFPSNSYSSRERASKEVQKAPPKLEQIASGHVVQKSLGKRTRSAIFVSDMQDVGSYLFWEMFIPSVKQMVSELVTGGVERALFGESVSSSRRRTSTSRIRYTDYSSNRRYDERNIPDRNERYSKRSRTNFEFDQILLDSRMEAIDIIENLRNRLDTYGTTTVADLYDLTGISTSYTDKNWGWTRLEELRNASYRNVPEGFILDIPDPKYLGDIR